MSTNSQEKKLHPRNKHLGNYDFKKLEEAVPALTPFIHTNEFNNPTINFNNPDAVKALNKALLKVYYGIDFWEIPKNNLCPPIPGRADYIHYIADIMAKSNEGVIPRGNKVKVLDIGVGANCIYPILGHQEYGWNFVGSETVKSSLKNAIEIVKSNPSLRKSVELRFQNNPKAIFKDIILPNEKYDFVICNPPFFKSQTEALQQSARKLTGKKPHQLLDNVVQAFSGQGSELWCEGGEKAFISKMIFESKFHKEQVKWFSTLVANHHDIRFLKKELDKLNPKEYEVIRIEQGNKVFRMLLWRF